MGACRMIGKTQRDLNRIRLGMKSAGGEVTAGASAIQTLTGNPPAISRHFGGFDGIVGIPPTNSVDLVVWKRNA
jgi:hypothetical protein